MQGDTDSKWVRMINRVSKRIPGSVMYLERNRETANRNAITSAIRQACSEGKTVVVANWYPQGNDILCDPESISLARDVNGEAEWQGAYHVMISMATTYDLLIRRYTS